MSDKRYKVENKNKFDVGIKFMDGIRQANIKPNSFAMLTEDEIYYLHSISKLFSRKILTVADQQINENLGFVEEKSSITEEEIETILKSALTKMKKDIQVITEPHQKYTVFEVAKKLYSELNGSKLDFLAEFCGKEVEDFKPVKETIEETK